MFVFPLGEIAGALGAFLYFFSWIEGSVQQSSLPTLLFASGSHPQSSAQI